MEKTMAHVEVFGRVRGVGFRLWAKKTAEQLNLSGYIKNIEDYVEIEVEGRKKNIDVFIRKCEHGPVMAVVNKLFYFYGREKGFKGFAIE